MGCDTVAYVVDLGGRILFDKYIHFVRLLIKRSLCSVIESLMDLQRIRSSEGGVLGFQVLSTCRCLTTSSRNTQQHIVGSEPGQPALDVGGGMHAGYPSSSGIARAARIALTFKPSVQAISVVDAN
jgi:hypothetical protein